jgi:hypothetical protein
LGIFLNNKLKKLISAVYGPVDVDTVQEFIDNAVEQTGVSVTKAEEEVYKMVSDGTSLEDMIRYKRFPMMLWCVAQLKENEKVCKTILKSRQKS